MCRSLGFTVTLDEQISGVLKKKIVAYKRPVFETGLFIGLRLRAACYLLMGTLIDNRGCFFDSFDNFGWVCRVVW